MLYIRDYSWVYSLLGLELAMAVGVGEIRYFQIFTTSSNRDNGCYLCLGPVLAFGSGHLRAEQCILPSGFRMMLRIRART